jgi:Ca-activated chloride channel family protein
MTFLYPEFILFIIIPIIWLFYLFMTNKSSVQTIFSTEIHDKLSITSSALSLRARNALFLLIFLLLTLALARPVFEEGKVEVEAKGVDIILAIDISTSMLAEDFYPNRLHYTKAKIDTFLAQATKHRVGIIAFAKAAYVVSPLSLDKRAVRYLVDHLEPSQITEQGTSYLHAIEAVKSMRDDVKNTTMIIFTDGGDQENFSKEIEAAKTIGLTLHIVSVATQKGAPIKQKDGSFLKHNGKILIAKRNNAIKPLALQTGGAFMQSIASADDMQQLIDHIEKTSVEEMFEKEEIMLYQELFYFPLALALFLLLIALSSLPKRTFLLLFALTLPSPKLQAGLLDFQQLDAAKHAYEHGDYNQSASLYAPFDQMQSHYNRANALLKSEQKDQAITTYESIQSDDPNLMADTLHNLGNAYALKQEFEKAIETYEKALELRDDQATKENLEAVKKFLKEQEQQQNQQDNNSSDSPESDNSNPDQQQKSDSQQNNDQQNQQQNSGEQTEEEKQEEQKASKEQEAKEHNEPNKHDQENATQQEDQEVPQQMSQQEFEKWMRHINEQKLPTKIFKIESQPIEENTNEKPW